jgi:hypothetical protein
MMKETNNMALVTSKVVVKMNKLEEKLDQQVAVLKRQSESFRVHYAYLEGQKAAARQASEASDQHQRLATQVDNNTEQNGKTVFLLRELKDGLRGSLEKTEGGMKSCFEFAPMLTSTTRSAWKSARTGTTSATPSSGRSSVRSRPWSTA